MIDSIKSIYINLHTFMCGYETKNDEKLKITNLNSSS
jgi:hypothetical protein